MNRGKEENQEARGKWDLQGQVDHEDRWAHKAQLGQLDQQGQQDHEVNQDREVNQELPDQLVHVGNLVNLDLKVLEANQEHQVHKGQLDSQGQEENVAKLGQGGAWAFLDHLAQEGNLGLLDQSVHRVQEVYQACQDSRALQVLQEVRVQLVCKDHVVNKEREVNQDNAVI